MLGVPPADPPPWSIEETDRPNRVGVEHPLLLNLEDLAAGEGEAGMAGGPPGDLYVQVEVRPHPIFRRDGNDLHVVVPIPMTRAALGESLQAAS